MYILPSLESMNDSRGSDASTFWKVLPLSGLICKTSRESSLKGKQVNSASLPSITVIFAGSIVIRAAEIKNSKVIKTTPFAMLCMTKRA